MNITKVKNAISRIEKAQQKFGSAIFMGHSGGKDSTVILSLAKHVLPKVTIVHNVKPMLGTSNDPVEKLTEMHPHTLRYLYEDVARHNYVHFMHSSMMANFLKINELQCQLDGARASEYTRAGKSSEIIVNGKSVSRKDMTEFVDTGMFGIAVCYPIFDWTDDDVFDYIYENNLKISQEYYIGRKDDDGRNLISEWDRYWERRLEREAW